MYAVLAVANVVAGMSKNMTVLGATEDEIAQPQSGLATPVRFCQLLEGDRGASMTCSEDLAVPLRELSGACNGFNRGEYL